MVILERAKVDISISSFWILGQVKLRVQIHNSPPPNFKLNKGTRHNTYKK
jgi:hypothetical protein